MNEDFDIDGDEILQITAGELQQMKDNWKEKYLKQGAIDEFKREIKELTELYKKEDSQMFKNNKDVEEHIYHKGRKHAFEDYLELIEKRVLLLEKEMK
jgi:hypothetical protein